MARRRNEICVEWLESKDKGQKNCVNVKHVIGDLVDLAKDSVVAVKLNSRRYQAKVVDLLDWKPPKQRKKKPFTAAKKTKKPKRASKDQEKPLFLGNGSPAKGHESSTSIVDSEGELEVEETSRRALSELTNIQQSPPPQQPPPSPPHSPLQLSSPHHSSYSSPITHHTRLLMHLSHLGCFHSLCPPTILQPTHLGQYTPTPLTCPTHLGQCTHTPLTRPIHLG